MVIHLVAKEPDCPQISASLELIEGKKEEVLAITGNLETEFDKIKKTEEAERIGDEADALVDRVDKETNTARSYLAAQVKMSSGSSKQLKMPRLEGCLRGEAAETIKGLGCSQAAYDTAISRLQRK